MQPIEIIVALVAFGLVSFTIVFNIIRKKKGKSCCGNCSSCSKGCNK